MVFVGCLSTPHEAMQTQGEIVREKLAGAPISVSVLPMRVGLEYLPPPSAARDQPWSLRRPTEHDWSDGPPSLPSLYSEPRRISVIDLRPESPEGPLTRNSHFVWQFELALSVDKDQLEAIEDPFERMTMLFVRDLIGADRRRLTRELGSSILTRRMLRHDDTSMLHTRFRELEEEQEADFLEDEGRGLLRRPLRKLLKKNTFIGDLKLMIDEFKAENIPLSAANGEGDQEGWGWGSVSMRVKIRDSSNPLELSYRNWGAKIGSSKDKAKFSYSIDLTENLRAGLRMRYHYDDNHTQFQANLRYILNKNAHLYMVLADSLNYLSGPTAYAFMSSPMDGEGGILFYVEHLF